MDLATEMAGNASVSWHKRHANIYAPPLAQHTTRSMQWQQQQQL